MHALLDPAVELDTEPVRYAQQAMEIEHRSQEPEEDACEQEIDHDVKAQKREADFGWQPDAAPAVEVAEFDDWRHVAYDGDATEATHNNQHADQPEIVFVARHEGRTDYAGAL